jgi:hypothetical protein
VRVLLGSLVAQRDAGIEVDAPGQPDPLAPLAVWAAAVKSAVVLPGMADCRSAAPGWCPFRPGPQIQDTGGVRIVLTGFAPLAFGAATGDRFTVRMRDPTRHAAVHEVPGPGNPG